jgi:hypothetical protein
MWFDRQGAISEASRNFGPVLRLFGLERFRDGQLPGRGLWVDNPFWLPQLSSRHSLAMFRRHATRTSLGNLNSLAPVLLV